MNLPPKQMKRQVMQRVTASPVATQELKPDQQPPAPMKTLQPVQPEIVHQEIKTITPAQATKPVKHEIVQEKAPKPVQQTQKQVESLPEKQVETKKEPINKIQNTAPTSAPKHKNRHSFSKQHAASISHDKFRPQATPAGSIGKTKPNALNKNIAGTPKESFKALAHSGPRHPETAAKDPSMALRQRLDETSEALPVLRAFQEFLDTERKRSRRHITILTTCFSIILILIVLSGVLGGLLFMKPLKDEYKTMRETLESYKAETKESRDYIQSSLVGISKDMQKEKATLSTTKDDLKLLTDTYDKTLNDLRGIIDTLTTENTDLQSDMKTMKSNIPALNRELNRALEEIATLRADFQPTTELDKDKDHPSQNYVTVSTRPNGSQRDIKLRLPIGE